MKNFTTYLITFSIILLSGYFANQIRNSFQDNDEYELIKKYLLNDSPLYGFNKPKLWVHSKYEMNARKWKSFQSRNSNDLNMPYIHLTIKSLINHCGNDFNVCLIDDETFSKLIPSWDIDLKTIAEPMRSRIREVGMMKLVYYYGGMVVPNSFLCMRNLIELYKDGISGDNPFICENKNRASTGPLFSPDTTFFGAEKNNKTVKSFIEYLKKRNTDHFNSEFEFLGDSSKWWMNAVKEGNVTMIDGKKIGVKTNKNKPILIDDVMGEDYLGLDPDTYGIYLPYEEILKRTKYQWFAVIGGDQLLNTNLVVAKCMKASLVDSAYDRTQRSVISI
jgi:hypothetical protein